MEAWMKKELEAEFGNSDFKFTKEEMEQARKEAEEEARKMKEVSKLVKAAKTPQEMGEALLKAIQTAFGDMAKEAVLWAPDNPLNDTDCYQLVWEGGSPFEWAVTMTGQYTWMGITGYDENKNVFLEPGWSFSLIITEAF